MKTLINFFFVFVILNANALSSNCTQNIVDEPHDCTVITLQKGSEVFFGGNDDYIYPDSYYWVDSGDSIHYGVIWIGTRDNVQQGVSETGLAYDANGLPRFDVNPHKERKAFHGGYTDYPIQIMKECATVEEVIDWVKTHQWHSFMHDQMHFADKSGDAVIISAGDDGELVFTRKKPGDGFLVSTNFNVANPDNGFGYPCWRYDMATDMLRSLVDQTYPVTLDQFRDVMDNVHVEGVNSWTIETMIADLTQGKVYIYFFYQYDKPLVLDVKEELAYPSPEGNLSALFPEEVRNEARQRYEELRSRGQLCHWLAVIWLISVVLSFLIFVIAAPAILKRSWIWIIGIIVLGPVSLLLWLFVVRRKTKGPWLNASSEVIGDLIPVVFFYFIAMCLLLLVRAIQSNMSIHPWLVFGMPVLLGWLFYHRPLLKSKSDLKGNAFLFRRLPHVLITNFLGMAGLVIVSMPVLNMIIQNCQIVPVSIWTIIVIWASVAIGGLLSIIILFFYEFWSVKKGYLAWSSYLDTDQQATTPGWKQLWWCVLISLIVLVLAIIGGVMINNGMQ